MLGSTLAATNFLLQLPPVPEELKEWAQDTTLATFAGMLLGGMQQWLEERRAGPIAAPTGAPTKAHAARAIAEEQTQRLARISNSTLKGGVRVGGLAAVFYAVQMLSGIYRSRHDFHDTAYGGMAAGALLGYSWILIEDWGLIPGFLAVKGRSRIRSSVLGAALGASIGVPAGLLQDKVVEWMPEDLKQRRAARFLQTEDILAGTVKPTRELSAARGYDVTAAVIAQLEASLSSTPHKQESDHNHQQQPQQHHHQQQQQQQQPGRGRPGQQELGSTDRRQFGEQREPLQEQQLLVQRQPTIEQEQEEQRGRRWWRWWLW
ncbi:hypothetical protein N2152v2_001590 [Parachlorella kessleri]